MKSTKIFVFLSVVALALALVPVSAAADPQKDLAETVARIIEVLEDKDQLGEEALQEKVEEVIGERFSFYVIGRRALGRNWSRLDQDQQERFTALFTDLLVKTYTERYRGDEDIEVTWGKTVRLTDRKMEIDSTIILDGEPAAVLYRLAELDEGWQVYDVIIEGVSLVGNYREQFNSILNKEGPDELIANLRAKVEEQ